MRQRLLLSLLVSMLVLRTGRTIILHGVVLLVIFAVYLFTTVVPWRPRDAVLT